MIRIPGKISITIYPIFWLLAALIGWSSSDSLFGTAIWIVIIFVSVLIHEYGHALTALACGQQARIELVGLGGVTQRIGKKIKLWQEFLIVCNGPVAGLILSALAYICYSYLAQRDPGSLATAIARMTFTANLFWTVLNLVPVHPLDGGRLLSILLESLFGIRGIQAALLISSILSMLISLFFFWKGGFLGGALFLLLGFESFRAWRDSLVMADEDQDEKLQTLLKEAETAALAERNEEAAAKFYEVRERAPKGLLYLLATTQLATLLARQGKEQEAYDLLLPIEPQLQGEELRLLHQLAYRMKQFETAISLGQRVYHVSPDYSTALQLSFSHALLGHPIPAIGWLQRAIGDGLPNVRQILAREEFKGIQQHPQFQAVVRKYV